MWNETTYPFLNFNGAWLFIGCSFWEKVIEEVVCKMIVILFWAQYVEQILFTFDKRHMQRHTLVHSDPLNLKIAIFISTRPYTQIFEVCNGTDMYCERTFSFVSKEKVNNKNLKLTITFQALSDEPEQHLSTEITKVWWSVGMNVQHMWPDLELFFSCLS